MKSGPKADFPVKVIHEPSELEPPQAELYGGVFTAVLNYVVDIVFVPGISAIAPPWDDHLLPADVDDIATFDHARLASALFGRYVVTPYEARAGDHEGFESGDHEGFEWGHDREHGTKRGVVFYVTSTEFGRYAVELAQLAEMNADSVYPRETASALRGYEVIGFLERRVLASPWLRPEDAVMLCLSAVH